MKKFLEDLQGKVTVGLIGGSDFSKISEQMNCGPDCKLVKKWMFYSFFFLDQPLKRQLAE